MYAVSEADESCIIMETGDWGGRFFFRNLCIKIGLVSLFNEVLLYLWVPRYMHAKKYSEAIELLSSGAVAMLKHGQVPIRLTMWNTLNAILLNGMLLIETLLLRS